MNRCVISNVPWNPLGCVGTVIFSRLRLESEAAAPPRTPPCGPLAPRANMYTVGNREVPSGDTNQPYCHYGIEHLALAIK